ncbi:hypothetical protein ACKWTF_011655 [Chironomus riparius]
MSSNNGIFMRWKIQGLDDFVKETNRTIQLKFMSCLSLELTRDEFLTYDQICEVIHYSPPTLALKFSKLLDLFHYHPHNVKKDLLAHFQVCLMFYGQKNACEVENQSLEELPVLKNEINSLSKC